MKPVQFAQYNGEGRITLTASVPPGVEKYYENIWLGEADIDLHYIKNNKRVDRPKMVLKERTFNINANGVDQVRLLDLPFVTEVDVDGPISGSGIAETGEAVLTFTVPGTYIAYLKAFPYQDEKVEIYAT